MIAPSLHPPPPHPLARAPRAAAALASLLAAYALTMEIAAGWGLPRVLLSWPSVLLGLALVATLAAGAAAPFLDPAEPAARRWAAALTRGGLALLLAGAPLSLVARTERVFEAAEGDAGPPEAVPTLPVRRFGAVRVAPRGDNPVLSKSISVAVELADGSTSTVGLWPPTRLGAWRLSVLRYGFAPGVDWRDQAGDPVAQGHFLLGTLPRTAAETALVTWTPEPNVMLGVGLYPPRVEDLVRGNRPGRHLFLRLQSAVLAGTRRAVADPSAHRWLADGRAESPEWFAQVLENGAAVWSGTLRPGERVSFPGGSLLLVPELRLWVELQAVRDPFGYAAALGALAAAAGLLLRLAAWRRAA